MFLATFMVNAEINDENKCTSFAGRFDGPTDAPWQCQVHRPMDEVQGFGRSHWKPPLSKYLLCIAPAAIGVTYKTMTIKNTPTLLAIPMAMAMHQ
jgi:hypothetical protein